MSNTHQINKLYEFFSNEPLNPFDELNYEELEELEGLTTLDILNCLHTRITYLIYYNQEGGEREQQIIRGLKEYLKKGNEKWVNIMLKHLKDVEYKFNLFKQLQIKINACIIIHKNQKFFLDALYSPNTILGQKKINNLYNENF